MTNVNSDAVLKILSKMGFETQLDIIVGNNMRKGPPVIKSADTRHSHFSAMVRKVYDQGMMWMAPKRAITPLMVQIDGRFPKNSFFSTGE